jgi:hypothetical protein
MHGQMVSWIATQASNKKKVNTLEDCLEIISGVREEFGYQKEESTVEPPEVNNDVLHPNYKVFQNLSPEEVWELVEDLDFSPNLAEELRNRYLIDLNLTYQWLHEYRKFLVLMVLFSYKIIPSIKIEAVWRLHMSMTENYQEFMSNLHATNVPDLNFSRVYDGNDYEMYAQTLSCYKTLFEEDPPGSIWESSGSRFDRER